MRVAWLVCVFVPAVVLSGCDTPSSISEQTGRHDQNIVQNPSLQRSEGGAIVPEAENPDRSASRHPVDEAATGGPPPAPPVVNSPPERLDMFQPFYVFSDKGSRLNHYIPSGFMPNGRCLSFDDRWKEDCYAGSTCIKIEYDVVCSRADEKWAGIYWLNPANNWGQRKGGFNLTGAQKLTFWARGAKGGEQIQEFTVGGITGNYPDSDIAVIGPVILSAHWRQYTIDLRGKNLSYISGGLAWSTSEDVNPDACTFFLDEILFE